MRLIDADALIDYFLKRNTEEFLYERQFTAEDVALIIKRQTEVKAVTHGHVDYDISKVNDRIREIRNINGVYNLAMHKDEDGRMMLVSEDVFGEKMYTSLDDCIDDFTMWVKSQIDISKKMPQTPWEAGFYSAMVAVLNELKEGIK